MCIKQSTFTLIITYIINSYFVKAKLAVLRNQPCKITHKSKTKHT